MRRCSLIPSMGFYIERHNIQRNPAFPAMLHRHEALFLKKTLGMRGL
jgi:hypothetical protein